MGSVIMPGRGGGLKIAYGHATKPPYSYDSSGARSVSVDISEYGFTEAPAVVASFTNSTGGSVSVTSTADRVTLETPSWNSSYGINWIAIGV